MLLYKNNFGRSAAIALVLQAVFALLAFIYWYGIANDCCAPLNLFKAISSNQGAVHMGQITQAQADYRIAQAQAVYLRFVWDQAKLPLLFSTLMVPLFAWFIRRVQSDWRTCNSGSHHPSHAGESIG